MYTQVYAYLDYALSVVDCHTHSQPCTKDSPHAAHAHTLLYLGILVERERGGDVLLFVLSFRRKSLRWKNPGRILAPGERERERERERDTHTQEWEYTYTHTGMGHSCHHHESGARRWGFHGTMEFCKGPGPSIVSLNSNKSSSSSSSSMPLQNSMGAWKPHRGLSCVHNL